LALGEVLTVALLDRLHRIVDLVRAEEQQVASLRVHNLSVVLLLVLGLLLDGSLDLHCLEELLGALDRDALLHALLFELARDLFRESLGTVTDVRGVEVVKEVASDRSLPGLGGDALARHTTEDGVLRRAR